MLGEIRNKNQNYSTALRFVKLYYKVVKKKDMLRTPRFTNQIELEYLLICQINCRKRRNVYLTVNTTTITSAVQGSSIELNVYDSLFIGNSLNFLYL